MSIVNGLAISGEIKLFKEKLKEARELFSVCQLIFKMTTCDDISLQTMQDINVAIGVDEILTEVLTIKRYMKCQFVRFQSTIPNHLESSLLRVKY